MHASPITLTAHMAQMADMALTCDDTDRGR